MGTFTLGQAFAKDGIVEINGVVQTKPASGLLGEWNIAGKRVRADGATMFKQELAPIAVGAVVEVKGTPGSDGAVLAQSIEVKQAAGAAGPLNQDAGEITGAVELLPATGLTGAWHVAGRTVIVVAATRIDQERGGVAVGTIVEVHGTANSDGSIAASEIEVKGGGTPSPRAGEPETEILGTLEALPATGLVGPWTVAGRQFTVNASTVLDAEHGVFAVGGTVEVDAVKAANGALVARRIERKAGQGADVPAARFWGRISALPATALMGVWNVDGTIVDVTPSTELHVEAGAFARGAIVEVAGWVQADGSISAREITTRATIGELPGQGTIAVEFRNARLGHFFVTASTAEIAGLDAGAFGGEWQRTGETFKVGGPVAVCRFYGMPPRGPNSHFFTASARECEHVMGEFAAWTFEDHAFSTTAATDGQCAAGLVPVHRFYNQPQRSDDVNHRYTVTAAAFTATTAMGWVHEGVVMCTPS